MKISVWLLTAVLLVAFLGAEVSAMPLDVSDDLDAPDAPATVPPHRHRHHRHHHKKRRSLALKEEKDARGRGKMMLTKPYWPWP